MVSIIVPVYNAETYLKDAVNSVLCQTYTDWELLLIDDCSTDGSLSLAKQLAANDSRIRVFSNDKNSGPAHTRNVGIDLAKGEWLAFLDSDDLLKPNFLSRMVETGEELDADIVWSHYDELNKNGVRKPVVNAMPKGCVINQRQAIESLFHNEPGIGSLCNKLFKKSLLHNNDLRINERRVRAEDWELIWRVFQVLDSLVCIDDSLYEYVRQNESSVMATYRAGDFELMCESMRMMSAVAEKYSVTPRKGFYGENLFNFLEFAYKASIFDKSNSLRIIKDMTKSSEYIFCYKDADLINLSKTYRLLAKLMNISPFFAVNLARLHHIVVSFKIHR